MDKQLSARQRRPSMAKRKKRRIGAFSRRLSLSDLDLRTNAGKFANSSKGVLEAQIGDPYLFSGEHTLRRRRIVANVGDLPRNRAENDINRAPVGPGCEPASPPRKRSSRRSQPSKRITAVSRIWSSIRLNQSLFVYAYMSSSLGQTIQAFGDPEIFAVITCTLARDYG